MSENVGRRESLPVSGSRDLELAEATARRALELKGGNHPDFLFELAKVLAARGEMDQAETYRQKATSVLKKEDWDVNYLRYISSIDLKVALSQQARSFTNSCQNRGETQG